MQTNKLIGLVTDITGESFEVPVYNADLENLIEESEQGLAKNGYLKLFRPAHR